MLFRSGITTSSLSDTSKVADWSAVPSTYRDAVSVCYNMGMLSGTDGKGTFNGSGVMTRAQAAVVMDRLIDGETPTPLPAGATSITKVSQAKDATGAVECEGGFFFDSTTVGMECSMIGFDTVNYSTLTFTVKATDTDVQVRAGHTRSGLGLYDPGKYYGELLGVVRAGESKTFTVDCSGDEATGVILGDNNHAGSFSQYSDVFVECWITDIYLY